ncbi:polyamine aminopropyltransferase [Spirulina major CS-329]|uniref:polyamine aminopropyltransferase n=1 Tax=Spirulina TaxID=1154 RepID=UPI00232FA169|nr:MULTISPECIES: polyamine aminopropyltransferase [Spirulina]MDB9494976.1 polyamine aminopropyltransferase [Spirulina subsalsa CS-330]MDB9501494.1 polyamine aminopropyltransferase [Spirulina major CS-329]
MSTAPHAEFWATETHDFLELRYRATEVLFAEQSPFQHVEIVNTEKYGKILLNDGYVMITEADEFIYHDMLVHVPLFTHPHPQRVLIIGGGDGGTAREVLRHPSVEQCVMVEIDEVVVNACRQHIPQTAQALDHPKLTLHIEDGVKYVAETAETFDVVLVDSTDPIGPATPLFGETFYRDLARILNPGGLVVSQGESPFYFAAMQHKLLDILHRCFPTVGLYNYSNMSYPGGLWSFTFASQGLDPIADFDPARVTASGLEFHYYNPAIHRAAFALPTFMQRQVNAILDSPR